MSGMISLRLKINHHLVSTGNTDVKIVDSLGIDEELSHAGDGGIQKRFPLSIGSQTEFWQRWNRNAGDGKRVRCAKHFHSRRFRFGIEQIGDVDRSVRGISAVCQGERLKLLRESTCSGEPADDGKRSSHG